MLIEQRAIPLLLLERGNCDLIKMMEEEGFVEFSRDDIFIYFPRRVSE